MAAGQADAVIGHGHAQLVRLCGDGHGDAALVVRFGITGARFNRFGGVLEHVGHGLTELVAIAGDGRNIGVGGEGIGDVGIGHFAQEQGLPHQINRVLLPEHRLGQAREAGEFVDHLAQVTHLPDDGVGQLLEQLGVFLDLLAITAAKAFGRQLDRGQRVLDLVRDAPRHVGPGRLPLIEQLAGDILEGDHLAISSGRKLDRQGQQLAILAVLHQPAGRPVADE